MSEVFCFIRPKALVCNAKDLFLDDDVLIPLDVSWTHMSHVVHSIGLFSSVSEARRNGWNIPILKGMSKFSLSKRFGGRKLFVYDPEFTPTEWLALEILFCPELSQEDIDIFYGCIA